jgi:hypothetical protein
MSGVKSLTAHGDRAAVPGVYTSEFYVTILTALYAVLNTTGVLNQIPPRYGAIVLAVVTALYSFSRGLTKSNV